MDIIRFSRKIDCYGCFSNFFSSRFELEGIVYYSGEAAFQAHKVLEEEERKVFAELSPSSAKRMGRQVRLRPDWEEVKYDVMIDVLRAKFGQSDNLKESLLSTGDSIIVEDTTGWHDNIWGDCDCPKCKGIEGKNLLGKALMQVREEFKN